MYQKALSNKGLQTIYIDGFAGSGEVPLAEHKDDLLDEEVKTVIAGSADRALAIEPPFNRYVFVDKRGECIDALKSKFEDHPNADRVSYCVGDANERIQQICQEEQWRYRRGVVLLDPFGNQVQWDTVEAIAETEALDLWYLFPAGLGVFRQISNQGTVDPTHERSLTRLFGTEDWKTAFLKPSPQGDLFGGPVGQEKVVTPESAALFMIDRLKQAFRGGVIDEMIPLGNLSYTSYYLLFAWGNSSPKAKTLANRLSKAAIKATDRRYGRTI